MELDTDVESLYPIMQSREGERSASYVAQVVVLTKFSDSLINIETKLRAGLIIAIECMACEEIDHHAPSQILRQIWTRRI